MSDSKGVWEKTVQLTSGGFVKVEVIGHPLDMAEDDRTFVEQLVDSISEYERDAKKYGPPQPEVLAPPPDGQDVGKVRATNNTGDGQ